MATRPILLALIFFQNCGPIFSNETMVKYRTAGEKSMEVYGGDDENQEFKTSVTFEQEGESSCFIYLRKNPYDNF